VTVDLVPPSEVTPTLAYTSTANAYTVVTPGDTVRDGSILSIDWTASSDSSTARIMPADEHLTPVLSALTAYSPPGHANTKRRLARRPHGWRTWSLTTLSNPTPQILARSGTRRPPDYIVHDGLDPSIVAGWTAAAPDRRGSRAGEQRRQRRSSGRCAEDVSELGCE
jgi:hypothetical protein